MRRPEGAGLTILSAPPTSRDGPVVRLLPPRKTCDMTRHDDVRRPGPVSACRRNRASLFFSLWFWLVKVPRPFPRGPHAVAPTPQLVYTFSFLSFCFLARWPLSLRKKPSGSPSPSPFFPSRPTIKPPTKHYVPLPSSLPSLPRGLCGP